MQKNKLKSKGYPHMHRTASFPWSQHIQREATGLEFPETTTSVLLPNAKANTQAANDLERGDGEIPLRRVNAKGRIPAVLRKTGKGNFSHIIFDN